VRTGRSVLVVGGGIVGLCTAYYCLQRGFDVTVVERGGPDHDGCSLGNAGMVVPSHFIPLAAPGMVGLGLRMLRNPEGPFALRPRAGAEFLGWLWRFHRSANAEHVRRSAPVLRDLSLASRAAFEELAAQLDDFGLARKGLLMLCRSADTLHEEAEVAKAARALGLEAEVLTPDEAARLDPALKMDVAGGVYFPQDCHLDPQRLMAGLTRALEAGGARLAWNTEVTGWRARGGRVEAAQTSKGDLTADLFVAAGGVWTAALLRGLGLRLPLLAGKGYSLTLPRPPALPSLCSILIEARVAVTPMGGALRFAGTMELGGADRSVNRRRVDGMVRSISAYFPEIGPERFRDVPVWSGLRPCSPDGLPYLGRSARYKNLVVAAGHAMLGVSLAPATGMLAAQLLAGEAPAIDLRLLRPERFA